jgi:hypothetical protein
MNFFASVKNRDCGLTVDKPTMAALDLHRARQVLIRPSTYDREVAHFSRLGTRRAGARQVAALVRVLSPAVVIRVLTTAGYGQVT